MTRQTPTRRPEGPATPFLDAARTVLEDRLEGRATRHAKTRLEMARRSPVRIQASVDPAVRARAHALREAVVTVGTLAVSVAGTVVRDVARDVNDIVRQLAQNLAPSSGVLATGRVPPGGHVRMPVVIENTTEQWVADVTFAATDLVSPGRAAIPMRAVSFSPSVVDLDPHSEETVTVTVQVPDDAKPGTYVGAVETHGTIPARATLAVRVET